MKFRALLTGITVSLAFGSLLLSSCASTSPSQTQQQESQASEWPRQLNTDGTKITVYQPQVETWSDNRLKERAVVSVQSSTSAEPVFGLIWITASTVTDSNSRMVNLENVQITRADFPMMPAAKESALDAVRKKSSDLFKPIKLDRLQADRAIAQSESKHQAPILSDTVPRIFFSSSPSILVLIDGNPVFRESGSKDFLRVINTRALLLRDRSTSNYFLYLGDRWLQAPSETGPWRIASDPPSSLDDAKDLAVNQKQVDLLDDERSPLIKDLKNGILPQVYTSTRPAELLQTQGNPKLQSITGTQLLYVENTSDNIFLHSPNQSYYVLLSGRWYRSKTLNGPWHSVSAKNLPKDFAKIPESHRKSAVLASVPGTAQAGEAAINNEIPKSAQVVRSEAKLEVQFDGTPQFKPIQGTKLQYAANTAIPVIRVGPQKYYAVRSGVWFTSSSPTGPWSVATEVAPEIYAIPPSSPLYYVTHVRIYDVTPEYVYTGYTPGYLGSYYTNGVVVYGTGYYYQPWIGTVWIGAPITFGLGWGYGGYYAPGFYPWWGPWWDWRAASAYPYPYPYPYAVYNPSPAQANNVYEGWSSSAVTSSSSAALNEGFVAETQPPSAEQWSAPVPNVPIQSWGGFQGGGWGGSTGGGGAPAAPSGGGGQAAGQAFQGSGWGGKR